MPLRANITLLWLPLLGAGLSGLAGCRHPGQHDQLGSANPLDRARAVVRAAEAHDVAAVHQLVDLLDDPDDAVRMYAIMGLRRLCGEDYGYQYYASPGARAAAVRRWRGALRAGEVVVRVSPGATGAGVDPEPAEDTGREQPGSNGSLGP
jgi:hypothetical protein